MSAASRIPPALQDFLAGFLVQIEEAAARGTARALEAQQPPKLDSKELGRLLGKKSNALRAFLLRNPSFPREKAGARLLFDREKVRLWLEARGK